MSPYNFTAESVRITRERMAIQEALAENAAAQGRESDAECHRYAAKCLFAISASVGPVTPEIAFKWRDEEKAAAERRTGQEALECAYSAAQLDQLGLSLNRTAGALIARAERSEATVYDSFTAELDRDLTSVCDSAGEHTAISGRTYREYIGAEWRVVLWMPLEPQAARYR